MMGVNNGISMASEQAPCYVFSFLSYDVYIFIADTCVWIDYFNGKITPQTDLLDGYLIEGIRDNTQYKKVKTKLALLDQHTMFGPVSRAGLL
jgi:hypothetical protein